MQTRNASRMRSRPAGPGIITGFKGTHGTPWAWVSNRYRDARIEFLPALSDLGETETETETERETERKGEREKWKEGERLCERKKEGGRERD